MKDLLLILKVKYYAFRIKRLFKQFDFVAQSKDDWIVYAYPGEDRYLTSLSLTNKISYYDHEPVDEEDWHRVYGERVYGLFDFFDDKFILTPMELDRYYGIIMEDENEI